VFYALFMQIGKERYKVIKRNMRNQKYTGEHNNGNYYLLSISFEKVHLLYPPYS